MEITRLALTNMASVKPGPLRLAVLIGFAIFTGVGIHLALRGTFSAGRAVHFVILGSIGVGAGLLGIRQAARFFGTVYVKGIESCDMTFSEAMDLKAIDEGLYQRLRRASCREDAYAIITDNYVSREAQTFALRCFYKQDILAQQERDPADPTYPPPLVLA
jgi:hypothetical protein